MTTLETPAHGTSADAARQPQLEARTDRVRRRWHRFGLARYLLLGTGLVLFVLWLLVVADAAWPLAPIVRGSLSVLWLVAVVVGGLLFLMIPMRRRRRRLHAASLLDHQLRLGAEPVATALSLEGQPDPLAEVLRRRAADSAEHVTASVRPAAVVPLSRLRWQVGAVGCVSALWVGTAIVFPTLPVQGVMRFLLPAADVPPFALTRFEVSWTPESPVVGEAVTVAALAHGRTPDTVEAVLLDTDLEPIDRRVMRTLEPARFEFDLRDLREPVIFCIEADGRRTRRYTIAPNPPEPVPAEDEPGQAAEQDDPGDASGALRPGSGEDEQGRALSGLMGRLAGLVSDLMALAERAQAAAAGDVGVDAALAGELQALQDEAAELAEALEAMGGMSPALADQLDAMSEALAGMEIAGLPAQPSDGAVQSDAEGQSARRTWAQALENAARSDAASLATGLGESLSDIESGLANRGGGEENPAIRDPQAGGSYDETLRDGERGVLPEALMRQVPPRYRDQTDAYFRRLAERRQASPHED